MSPAAMLAALLALASVRRCDLGEIGPVRRRIHRPGVGGRGPRAMRLNDFLPLLDREAHLLTQDNFHAAAAVVSDAAERLRRMAEIMRRNGLNPDEEP